jgi:MFS family permease
LPPIANAATFAPDENTQAALDRIMRRVRRRLLPFLAICLVANYLDRVNIGFAALFMNRDLGLSPTVFGLGSGVFFFSYALFEAPSNYLLAYFGARIWIARIMISWGLASGLMALAQGETSFLALRLLLGLAEAGFVPGVVLYLTWWTPHAWRAVSVSAFLLAIPVSSVIGAPLSGLILEWTTGLGGLRNWQWLFLIEAIPSVILGVMALFLLTDRPEKAHWLAPEDRRLLQAALDAESDAHPPEDGRFSLLNLFDRKTLTLSAIYFGVVLTLYGLVFWMPQIVHAFGYGPVGVGFLSAVPYVAGGFAMYFWSRHVDRVGGHVFHAIAASLLSAFGLAVCAIIQSPLLTIAALSLSAVGTFGAFPIFWTLATARLPPARATGAIAVINSIAALAGFLGPYVVGWIRDATGVFHYAPPFLALGPILSAVLLTRIAILERASIASINR